MLDQQLINKIKQKAVKIPNLLGIYAFGSYVKGYDTKESDLDLAFVVHNKRYLNEEKIYDLIKNIHFPKDIDVSVVDLSSSPLFLYEIISTGQRLYLSDELVMADFEASVLNSYYDNAHLRNIYSGYLKNKFSYVN